MRDDYNNHKRDIDEALSTGSVYGVSERDKCDLPADGTTISIRNIWSLQLFAGYACQFNTSLNALVVEP